MGKAMGFETPDFGMMKVETKCNSWQRTIEKLGNFDRQAKLPVY